MSSYKLSHIKELKEVTEKLKKFTVEDFQKTEEIIRLLNSYHRWSLLWNGGNFLNSEELLEMLDRCLWYAQKNDSTEF